MNHEKVRQERKHTPDANRVHERTLLVMGVVVDGG